MSSSQPLHLAAQLKVPFDSSIVKYPEAVDYRSGFADLSNNVVGLELEVLFMSHCEDYCVNVLERYGEVLDNSKVFEFFLIAKKKRAQE